MAAQGTPPHPAQTPARTGQGRVETLGVLGVPQPHPRDHGTRQEDSRRRRPDILRTIELGYSNARLEASDNRIKVTIRMAYGFHHVDNLTALITLRCGGLDIRLPQPTI
ncbi:transposase [Bifidobacterium longum]|uniref:transposase n=1 Tax=Bifidobacterium longum TaxID=216816 RepID=UPI0032DFFF41